MNQVVGMVEAKSKLAELVGQVKYGGKRYVLERRGRPMAMLVSVEEYEQLQIQVSAGAKARTSLLSPDLQRRQAALVERAHELEQRLGDPIAGLADLFSALPRADDNFWAEIQETGCAAGAAGMLSYHPDGQPAPRLANIGPCDAAG